MYTPISELKSPVYNKIVATMKRRLTTKNVPRKMQVIAETVFTDVDDQKMGSGSQERPMDVVNQKIGFGSQELAMDMVFEICLSLSIRKVHQFTCVSKSWRSIISDPVFSRAYERRNPPAIMIISGSNRRERYQEFHYAPLRVHKAEQFIELPLKTSLLLSMTEMVNGLACFSYHHRLDLCNVWTGEWMRLPPPNVNCGLADEFDYISSLNYYFGFDPVNKLYKVLKVTIFDCEILTLGSRDSNFSWRRILSHEPYYPVSRNNKIVINGVMFYDSSTTIGSFDFREEKFRHILTPDMGKPSLPLTCNFQLARFRGRLALMNQVDQLCMILYILNDTEGYSWTSYEIFLPPEFSSRPALYAGNLPTGEILFAGKSHGSSTLLYSYDCENNKFERLAVGRVPSSIGLDMQFLAPTGDVEQNFGTLDAMIH